MNFTSNPSFNTNWTVEGPDVVHPAEGTSLPRYMHAPWSSQPRQPLPHEVSGSDMAVDEPTPRPKDYSIVHPNISLPRPELEFSFRMSVALDTFTQISVTPEGEGKRAFMTFKEGSFSGPFGSGTVAPGGQAEVMTYSDFTDDLVTSYLLQTNDSPPAFVTLKSKGFRSGPPEVLQVLQNSQTAAVVDPNTFKSTLIMKMQTEDARYKEKVNYGFWIGSALKIGMEVVYDAYRVL